MNDVNVEEKQKLYLNFFIMVSNPNRVSVEEKQKLYLNTQTVKFISLDALR